MKHAIYAGAATPAARREGPTEKQARHGTLASRVCAIANKTAREVPRKEAFRRAWAIVKNANTTSAARMPMENRQKAFAAASNALENAIGTQATEPNSVHAAAAMTIADGKKPHDKNAKTMFDKYVDMVRNRSWKYAKAFNVDYEDVEAEGFKIYCICLSKHNPAKASFSTYLYRNLEGRLADYCEIFVNRTYLDNLDADAQHLRTVMETQMICDSAQNSRLCIEGVEKDYEPSRKRMLENAKQYLSPFCFSVLVYILENSFKPGSQRKPTVKRLAKAMGFDVSSVEKAWQELGSYWQERGYAAC